MEDSASALRTTTRLLMELEGAAVEEIEPAGFEFIAPGALQKSLGIPEHGRLGFGSDLPPGAQRVTLESDWLERLDRLLGERGRRAARIFDVPRRPISDPLRMLEHGLVLKNAVYRLLRVQPAWTRYWIIGFHYSALSDEKRDGVVQLTINLSNSSTPDQSTRALIGLATETEPQPGERLTAGMDLPPQWTPERLARVVNRGIPSRIRNDMSPFLKSMTRRLDRDLARLCDYYNDLRRESFLRVRRRAALAAKASSHLQVEEGLHSGIRNPQSELEAVSLEYENKVADVQQKYAIKVDVRTIQILELITPVQRFELVVKRRKRERRLCLDWNPISRVLEPPPCEHTYSADVERVVCDDALHFVSPESHQPCPDCRRENCQACSGGKCPRCGQ